MSYRLLVERDVPLFEAARPFLGVRNNDEHTLVVYGVARHLLNFIPEADENIVLPAVILHDIGWSRVPEHLLLDAIGRNATRPELVRDHEICGVEMARKILRDLKFPGVAIDKVLAIIDGHDTTDEARSINDAVMKDADKVWRVTPHGQKTIRGWNGTSLNEYLDAVETNSNPRLLTDVARAMATGWTSAMRAELYLTDYLETEI